MTTYISFRAAIESAYRSILNFEGRSSRAEFWYFVVFYLAVSAIAGIFIDDDGAGHVVTLAYSLFAIVTSVAGIALAVRRLHDIDRSGWWLLLGFIPLLGTIILLIWYTKRGDVYTNRFGANPVEPVIKVEIID